LCSSDCPLLMFLVRRSRTLTTRLVPSPMTQAVTVMIRLAKYESSGRIVASTPVTCVGYGFFLSSRGWHTSSKRDWSSDVCSSDLTATKTLKVDTASSTNDRIDRVIIRFDSNPEERKIYATIKKGTASANPSPPPVERSNYIHEMS